MNNENEIDVTKLRYVLYARKSSEEAARQVRSIDDQIRECRELASRLGLRIIDILEEAKSAKKPGLRPVFSQMLKGIREGKYDGIVSWNPDRLARNMLEGGTIIDLIDQEIIKDLKFVTHHFTKDANGKMLLGMAFVLSKQYSDSLSQNVTRGVRSNLQEGRTPVYKYGYLRDSSGLQRPDEIQFDLICTAWNMRREEKSLAEILSFLKTNKYFRVIQSTGEKQEMTLQKLSNMFSDPFYYGILIQNGAEVDLRKLYDFMPATSEEAYQEIQLMSRTSKRSLFKKKRLAFYPLKQVVVCSFCNSNMVVAPSTSRSKTKYLYFRCDNKLCLRKKKSIRAKNVFEFIYKFLEEGIGFTEKEYQRYRSSLMTVSEGERTKVLQQIHSLEGSVKQIKREMKRIALDLVSLKKVSERAYQINQERLQELEEQETFQLSELEKVRKSIRTPEADILTLDQFLNLSKNASTLVKMGDAIVKDTICRLIFLNLSVNEEKVVDFDLKEPFNSLLKNKSFLLGRGAGN